MSRIAILLGHPRKNTYCEALAEGYRRGAESGGHTVELIHVGALQFDPILRGAYVEVQPREPDLETACKTILAADHLVLIFPLWLGSMPALFKGFLERLLQPEVIGPAKEGRFVKLLKGKSARVIITMGMPGFLYRLWYGAPVRRILKSNILGFLGVHPVRFNMFGLIEGVGGAHRQSWIRKVERLGRSAR